MAGGGAAGTVCPSGAVVASGHGAASPIAYSAEDPTGGGVFLFLALVVGVLTRVLLGPLTGLPYTVLLLVFGVALGALATGVDLGAIGHSIGVWGSLDPHLTLFVFLPALIFGSAFSVDYHTFSREIPQMLVLAVPGVVLSSLLTAALAVFVFPYHWGWADGLAFGAMMSATDPVAVVALLRELGASKRLSLLIEGESLFNDGTAMVIFIVFSDVMAGKPLDGFQVVATFTRLAVSLPRVRALCGRGPPR